MMSAKAGRLARRAAELLRRELLDGGDIKRAKDLAGIMKDMIQLSESLRGGEARVLTVLFEPEAEEGGE